MSRFEHVRHKPPAALDRPRELVIACPQLQSNVNLSRVVRTASCCGVRRVIACGRAKIDPEIARDGALEVTLETRGSLPPVLRRLKEEGHRLIGLEQTTNSISLFEYQFPRRAALVLGHERQGLTDEVLALLDDVVEIPVYGLPHSHNVAAAADMALYEYCKQYPRG